MKKFDQKEWIPGLINALLLAGILVAIAGVNFVVDPFSLNRRYDLAIEKEAVSFKLSYYHWKLAQFKNTTAPVVLFGDSRTNALPEDEIARELGRPTYNFAFGGGNGFDAVDAFWFAVSQRKLERVYVGLNALILNDHNRVRRARRSLEVIQDPLRFYMSPLVTQATFKVLLFNFFGVNLVTEKPPMSEDEFWQYQLATAPGQMFGDYAYPDQLLAELSGVADYCKKNGIDLTFMILPTHVDLQARREDFGIVSGYRRSIRALRVMGEVLDWDYPNRITRDRRSFDDPFHMTPATAREIARELTSEGNGLAR
ncbi:MAG: hypothetical protein GY910_23530 [bacterium]|nr:hypothetical protein [Deltaproteobacteria bacterium]MCP4907954.1 hypothetical protein [bacterium]